VSGARAAPLRAGAHRIELGGRPLLMGVVNATPDSFSEAPGGGGVKECVERGRALLAAGAGLLDVGGESARTDRAPVPAGEEAARVVPVIERLAAEGAMVSVDTVKPAVAEAALAAGAVVVNDTSGLRDLAMAELCARTGAALVVVHTVGAPKQKVLDHPYEDVVAEVQAGLRERMAAAGRAGVVPEQLLLDPGPDLGKSPAQTVELLRGLGRLHSLGRPLLLAVSRKDFVGALTGRPPGRRDAGTLAAIGHGVDAGAAVLRVHDVAGTADHLAVRAALRGERPVPASLRLAPELRHEPSA